ncbi:hypothetical protein QBC35DRAFT_507945 [Podospora australis]|uniref:Secreted protein n=1 Tax=Podospora australis TaxID=1536484 RepID=A0AAN6WKH0_9PEZI|nr:hypothetical protein QBC35DRAFT_507945 [Podospora australis]
MASSMTRTVPLVALILWGWRKLSCTLYIPNSHSLASISSSLRQQVLAVGKRSPHCRCTMPGTNFGRSTISLTAASFTKNS